jgi:hypothetical protein
MKQQHAAGRRTTRVNSIRTFEHVHFTFEEDYAKRRVRGILRVITVLPQVSVGHHRPTYLAKCAADTSCVIIVIQSIRNIQ